MEHGGRAEPGGAQRDRRASWREGAAWGGALGAGARLRVRARRGRGRRVQHGDGREVPVIALGSLRSVLGRVDALAIGIGAVIGAGIFRTTGLVVASTGGLAAATGLWILGGVVSVLGALVYGDLATRVPEAGGPYAYVRDAFGQSDRASWTGWLQAGVSIPARQAASFAAIGEVLAELTGVPRPRTLGAAVLVVLLAVNLDRGPQGTNVQRVLTAASGSVAIGAAIALALVPAQHAPDRRHHRGPVGHVRDGARWHLAHLPRAGRTSRCFAEVLLIAHGADLLPFVLIATVLVVTGVYVVFQAAVALALHDTTIAASSFPARWMAETRLGSSGGGFLAAAVALVSMGGGVSPRRLLVRLLDRLLRSLATDWHPGLARDARGSRGRPCWLMPLRCSACS